jgi:transcriptional antiterminator NusG
LEDKLSESEPLDGQQPESTTEPEPVAEPVDGQETDVNSHLFAVRTTGGQEKIVMRTLEARMKLDQKDEEEIQKPQDEDKEIETKIVRLKDVHSVLLVDDLKGYVVVEAEGVSAMFNAIQGIRHVRGQLRGELTYDEIEKYLIKKSTVLELAVENTVEIIGGPFKGMKATVTRIDHEKEEATVVLLEASYQLPVTVDANYLKLTPKSKD